MNGLDVAIIAAGCIGMFSGLNRGVLRMATSLVGLAGAIYLAFIYYPVVRDLARKYIPMTPTVAAVVGYAIVFLIVMVVVQSAGGVLLRLVHTVNLGWIDRIAGGLAGGAITLAIVGLILTMATAALPTNSAVLKNSRLSPPLLHYTDALLAYIPPEIKDAYEHKRNDLMRNWAGEAMQGRIGPGATATQ
jgi:membrane protein required for colicin V production